MIIIQQQSPPNPKPQPHPLLSGIISPPYVLKANDKFVLYRSEKWDVRSVVLEHLFEVEFSFPTSKFQIHTSNLSLCYILFKIKKSVTYLTSKNKSGIIFQVMPKI